MSNRVISSSLYQKCHPDVNSRPPPKKVYKSLYFEYKLGKFDFAKILLKFKGKLNLMAGRQKHLPGKRCY